ncbi:hypothetical protein HDU96_007139 [Phlyctochytrium bullatum]|nr:hypothetical protein HDU96_007139 [Phlyctochytrium bullatum]
MTASNGIAASNGKPHPNGTAHPHPASKARSPSRKLTPTTLLAALVLACGRATAPWYVRLMVFRKILLLNDGRDKLLKVVQYGSKAVLHLNLIEKLAAALEAAGMAVPALLRVAGDGKGDKAPMVGRLEKLISHLSMARKIVRLAHVLEPVDTLVGFAGDPEQLALVAPFMFRAKQPPASFAARVLAWGTLLGGVIGIVNDLSDDAICLAKMGVLDKQWSKTCTPVSDRMWFASIFIDTHEIVQDVVALKAKLRKLRARRRELEAGATEKMVPEAVAEEVKKVAADEKKVTDKLFYHRVSLAKLGADFVFCTIDVFQLGEKGLVSDGWQVYSGLTAAILGTIKLYLKNSK